MAGRALAAVRTAGFGATGLLTMVSGACAGAATGVGTAAGVSEGALADSAAGPL